MGEARRGDGLPLRRQRGAPRRGVEAPLNDYDTASLIHPLSFVKNGLCETGLQLSAEEADSPRVATNLSEEAPEYGFTADHAEGTEKRYGGLCGE